MRGLQMRYLLALAAILVAVFVVAGCGGDGDDSSGSTADQSGSETSTSELSGEPIKIMTLLTETSSTGSSIIAPQVAPAAEATVEFVNDNGGVNGRPLELIVCDDRGEASQTEVCARKAVEEEVVSLVSSLSSTSDKIYPIIEKAEIASLATIQATAPDFSSKVAFPFQAGALAFPGTGQLAAEQKGCTEPGMVAIEGPAYELAETGIGGGLEAEGLKLAYSIPISPTVTDYSSQARQAAEGGNCLILFTVPDSAKPFVTAFRQITDQPIIAIPSTMSSELAAELADELEGTVVESYYPPWSSPLSAEYRETMETYSDPDKYDFTYYNGSNAYLAVRVFAQIASELDTLNAKTFTAALNKADNVDAYGLLPPLNLTPANEFPVPGFERTLNRYVVNTEVVDGEFVAVNDEFTDLTQIGLEAFGVEPAK